MDSDALDFDLERDHPVTAEDVRVLRILRAQTASWFSLPPEQLEPLLSREALERRPATPETMPPFTLE